MSKKTLKFDNAELNKEEFHTSKQSIALNLVNLNQILMSDKFEHSDTGCKYFISYKDNNFIILLCIILPHIRGYMKYFENEERCMSFVIENDGVPTK